jgi:F-type H+-transporting ATPase subunit epsilon
MNLEVVTPKGTAVTAEVDEVTAPGVRGEFGVLPGHTPFVTALRPGVLSWKKAGKRGVLAVAAGFAEVNGKDKIVVLTQSSATPDEIDAAAVQKELEELDRTGAPREDVEARRAWAQARLDARNTARS